MASVTNESSVRLDLRPDGEVPYERKEYQTSIQGSGVGVAGHFHSNSSGKAHWRTHQLHHHIHIHLQPHAMSKKPLHAKGNVHSYH